MKKRKATLMALFFIAETTLPLLGFLLVQQLFSLAPFMAWVGWGETLGLSLAAVLVCIALRYRNDFSSLASANSKQVYFLFILPFIFVAGQMVLRWN